MKNLKCQQCQRLTNLLTYTHKYIMNLLFKKRLNVPMFQIAKVVSKRKSYLNLTILNDFFNISERSFEVTIV